MKVLVRSTSRVWSVARANLLLTAVVATIALVAVGQLVLPAWYPMMSHDLGSWYPMMKPVDAVSSSQGLL